MFPNIAFYHLSRGLVDNKPFSTQAFPFPLAQIFSLAASVISKTIGDSPQAFAEIPVLLAANSSAEKQRLLLREGLFLDHKLKGVKISPYSEAAGSQEEVFQKLKSYL